MGVKAVYGFDFDNGLSLDITSSPTRNVHYVSVRKRNSRPLLLSGSDRNWVLINTQNFPVFMQKVASSEYAGMELMQVEQSLAAFVQTLKT